MTGHLYPEGCTCALFANPFDFAALGHMTTCPLFPGANGPDHRQSEAEQAADYHPARHAPSEYSSVAVPDGEEDV